MRLISEFRSKHLKFDFILIEFIYSSPENKAIYINPTVVDIIKAVDDSCCFHKKLDFFTFTLKRKNWTNKNNLHSSRRHGNHSEKHILKHRLAMINVKQY